MFFDDATVVFNSPFCNDYFLQEKYCSSFIGRRDFYENMVINYNDNGITSAIVMGCSTPLIPDMSLSFDDDVGCYTET